MTVDNFHFIWIDDFAVEKTIFIHIEEFFAIWTDHASNFFGISWRFKDANKSTTFLPLDDCFCL